MARVSVDSALRLRNDRIITYEALFNVSLLSARLVYGQLNSSCLIDVNSPVD